MKKLLTILFLIPIIAFGQNGIDNSLTPQIGLQCDTCNFSFFTFTNTKTIDTVKAIFLVSDTSVQIAPTFCIHGFIETTKNKSLYSYSSNIRYLDYDKKDIPEYLVVWGSLPVK